MPDSTKNPLYTEYRIIQEMYLRLYNQPARPHIYVYPTRYTSHDEAFGKVITAVLSAIANYHRTPSEEYREYIANENIAEIFYKGFDNETIVSDRWHICPIEVFEHITDKHEYYQSYTYRGYEITENLLRNRYSIQIGGKKVTKQKLNKAFDFIDGFILDTTYPKH